MQLKENLKNALIWILMNLLLPIFHFCDVGKVKKLRLVGSAKLVDFKSFYGNNLTLNIE